MKKVVVTGANGLLGSALKKEFERSNVKDSYVFLDKNILDITNREQTLKIIQAIAPDYVINCAAYTNVNKAEEEKEKARLINVDGVDNIATATWMAGGKLIHISTDYVFDGEKGIPYETNDETNPLNYYGETKRDGEISALCYPFHIVIRTSWLYSDTHNCFFTKVLEKLQNGEEMNVVNDEFGEPTNAYDLAEFLITTINQGWFDNTSGIYHYSNDGTTSWFDFAKKIEEIYSVINYHPKKMIKPCSVSEYNSPVKRPKNSTLSLFYTKVIFHARINSWEQSLVRLMTCHR